MNIRVMSSSAASPGSARRHQVSAGPSWMPRILEKGGPIYRQIAKALANDIRSGALQPGARLPGHRDLADALSVSVSTITKAYKEVGRLNLLTGRARAGTHVVRHVASLVGWSGALRGADAIVDLANNSVATNMYLLELANSLPTLSASERFADLQEYQPIAGHPHHRFVVARWLQSRGIQTEPEQIVITSGAHHALAATLSALGQNRPTLLAEELTYSPLGPLVRSLRMQIEPMAMNAHGVDPGDVERACKVSRKPVLFITPNINNPTTASLNQSRRQALVAIARRHDANIIEDDVYALLAESELPSLAEMMPERVFYVSSFAKAVAPSLCMGFVRAPDAAAAKRIAAAVGLSTRQVPTLCVELACQWMTNGTLDRIVNAHRAELERRVQLARSVFKDFDLQSSRFGPHLWLKLPAKRREENVLRAAAEAGVVAAPSKEFSVRGLAVQALRITVTAPRTYEELHRGLELLRGLVR